MVQLGYPKIWNSSNPFPWMELQALNGKTNFFEKEVAEYQMANVGQEEFSLNEEF